MKMFRYRLLPLNTILGITAAKMRVTRKLGIFQVGAWTKPSRVKQWVKQHIGLNSPIARVVRRTVKRCSPSSRGLLGGGAVTDASVAGILLCHCAEEADTCTG